MVLEGMLVHIHIRLIPLILLMYQFKIKNESRVGLFK